MAALSAKEIYDQHIKPLPLAEQLKLAELIACEISTTEDKAASKRSILGWIRAFSSDKALLSRSQKYSPCPNALVILWLSKHIVTSCSTAATSRYGLLKLKLLK